MGQPIKVVHAPARTPYARKLTSGQVQIVNDSAVLNGSELVPRDMSLRWLWEHRPFTWFDVLHLHHIEFDDISDIKAVLSECARTHKRVVFTAHDIDPIFGRGLDYHRKLSVFVDRRVPFVCLTEGSRAEVHRRFGPRVSTVTIPHGYVVAPSAVPRLPVRTRNQVRFLLFGSLRANRDIETVLCNWRFGRNQQDTFLSVLLRAPSRINLLDEHDRWTLLSAMAAAEPRLRVEIAPFPSDNEVAETAASCGGLLLPYRWGSHSGQLELAFDLGLMPIASAVGYLRDQYRSHAAVVDEPVWFDWSDGADYAYGARFLTALDEAAERLRYGQRPAKRQAFAEHRATEHNEIMTAYLEVYEQSWT
jgi:hypothetical protein